RALLELPPVRAEDFAPEAHAPAWLAPLQSKLDDAGLGRAQYVLRLVHAHDGQGGALQIEKKHHGLASVQLLSAAQLLHGELRQLIEVATQLDGLLQPGATVSRGGRTQAVSSFREVQQWLLEEAKKGR